MPPLSNELRINELLKDKLIQHELLETREIATLARKGESLKGVLDDCVAKGIYSGNSPKFRYIAEFQSALYSHERKNVYLAAWNISHSDIARKEDLQARDASGWQVPETGHYTSADVFILAAAKNIRVIIIDSLFDFDKEALSVIRKLGYSVLSPHRNWFLEESGNAINTVLSPISTGLG